MQTLIRSLAAALVLSLVSVAGTASAGNFFGGIFGRINNYHPVNNHPGNNHPGNNHPGNNHPGNNHPGNNHPGNDEGRDKPGSGPDCDKPGSPVPEPTSALVFGAGVFAVSAAARRRNAR